MFKMSTFILISILIIALTKDFISCQNINYFGVAYSPYVRKGGLFNSYSINEIKQMLNILVRNNRHNLISTYSMGVEGYNNGKQWYECDSNALVARAAAQINRDRGSVVISMSQGIFQKDDAGLQKREIDNAFSAASDANGIQRGTIWGLVFTNEYVTNGNNGPKVLKMIRDNKQRAKSMGLQIGTRVQTCGEINGGTNQNILKQIARESTFIMCNMYPGEGANDPARAVREISQAFMRARDGLKRENPSIEVMIGETGWATEGQTFNHAVNNVDNMRKFWDGMKSWAGSNRVRVHMFEAFDEPWKGGEPGEKHFGWWYRPNDDAKYIEKSTGQVYQ